MIASQHQPMVSPHPQVIVIYDLAGNLYITKNHSHWLRFRDPVPEVKYKHVRVMRKYHQKLETIEYQKDIDVVCFRVRSKRSKSRFIYPWYLSPADHKIIRFKSQLKVKPSSPYRCKKFKNKRANTQLYVIWRYEINTLTRYGISNPYFFGLMPTKLSSCESRNSDSIKRNDFCCFGEGFWRE